MRLTVTTFVTMDGVMQSPGGPEEDPRDGFDLGGWLPPHFGEETGQYMNEVFDAADAFLLGRFSYQAMAGFWPQVTDPANRVAAQFNSCPKYVVTATLADLSWKGAVPLRGDIPKQVAELKRARASRLIQSHYGAPSARSRCAPRPLEVHPAPAHTWTAVSQFIAISYNPIS